VKRLLKRSVAAAVALSAAGVLAVSGAAQAAGTPGWRYAPLYPQSDGIWSVSASGAANAWAVGQSSNTSCDMCLFTAHWNGTKWQTIAPPNALLGQVNRITGNAAVAATSGQRAWVFAWGEYAELGTSQLSAIEWTGTSWSAVHNFPSPVPGEPTLGTATASGPADVWCFGNTGSSGQTPWTVHYNGKSWSSVALPVSVAHASGNPAAGDWITGTLSAKPNRAAVMHWSKGAWRNVPLPAITVPKGAHLAPSFIDAVTPANVWTSFVISPNTGTGPSTTLVLHWNGSAWSKVPVPRGVSVYGLAGDGHGGAWVASYKVNKPGVYLAGLVMYHYSGGAWTHVTVPVKPGFVTNLTSDMQLIPGTRSVLAGATLFGPPIDGAVLKYGP
jgi:hypothetical protein